LGTECTLNLINPFIPHHPIDAKHFVGRSDELRRLEASLEHTKRRKPINFMITGDRGIGKTSLLNYVQAMARSYSDKSEESFRFIVVNIQTENTTTQLDFVRKVELSLRHELDRTEVARAFLDRAWSFVQRLEVAGVKLQEAKDDPYKLLWEEFANSLVQTVKRICAPEGAPVDGPSDAYDGILILVDEVDTAGKQFEIGAFLKYLTEYFQRNDCKTIMLGLSGLPKMVDVLLQSHRSVLRVFEEMRLDALPMEEVVEMVGSFLKSAETDNDCEFSIAADALQMVIHLSDGHPHFIQQHCYCAFNAMSRRLSQAEMEKARASFAESRGNRPKATKGLPAEHHALVIEHRDVIEGSFSPRGAIDLIGDMYFKHQLETKVSDWRSKKVLAHLSQFTDGWVEHTEIARGVGLSKMQTSELLASLIDCGLVAERRDDNSFRLRSRCLAYWLQKCGLGPQIDFDASLVADLNRSTTREGPSAKR
jgi:hypothetical protein